MQYIQEPPRKIPVTEETEVLVVGSGPAGLAAAISAARGGGKNNVGRATWLFWGQYHPGGCQQHLLVPL